jgi:hypothetical protein
MVSFPAAILPELQHHLDTYSIGSHRRPAD